MAKNSVLKQGRSYTLQITVKDQNGDVVSWDLVTDFILVIYAEKTKQVLKQFTKAQLTIDDPATGIVTALISGTVTESALEDIYIIEYKYKVGTEEIPEKGYWGRFVSMKTAKNHFV